jgi:hypothetical protein
MRRRKVDKREFVDQNASLFFCNHHSTQKILLGIEKMSLVRSKERRNKKNIDD